MEIMVPYSLVIALAIGFAVLAILQCASSEISHLHRVVDLTKEVNEKRERYIAQLRASVEIGEVEVIEDIDPAAES